MISNPYVAIKSAINSSSSVLSPLDSINCYAQLIEFDKTASSKRAKKNRTAFKRFYFIITNTEIGFIGWCPAMN